MKCTVNYKCDRDITSILEIKKSIPSLNYRSLNLDGFKFE